MCSCLPKLLTRRFGRDNVKDSEHEIQGNIRKVSIILFGVFPVEEITMLALVENAAKVFLIANPGIGEPEGEYGKIIGGPFMILSPQKSMRCF